MSHYTSVRYHNRSPLLFDQIKVELPEDLDEDHHLYFAVYQVSVSNQSSGQLPSNFNTDITTVRQYDFTKKNA